MGESKLTPAQVDVLRALAGVVPPWRLVGDGALAGFHTRHRETRDLDLFWFRSELGELDEEISRRVEAAGPTGGLGDRQSLRRAPHQISSRQHRIHEGQPLEVYVSRRIELALFVLALLAAAPAARADLSLNLEGFGGWQDLRLASQSVTNAVSGREGTAIFGGDVLLDLTGFGAGVAVDKTVSGTAQPWAGSVMGGLLFDLPLVRVEALGEIGRRGRDFGNLFDSGGATFVGVRPGATVRLPLTPLRVGLTALVRWSTSGGDIASPDYGLVGKITFELP